MEIINEKSQNNNISNNNQLEETKEKKKQPKSVKILNNVHVIQVENWKKYNVEQNLEPNFDLLNNGINDINNKNENNRVKGYKNGDAKCTCLII